MAFSDLLRLSNSEVESHVRLSSPGVYALDRTTTRGFTVNYVGRADDDLARRLKEHVTEDVYKYFKYEYVNSARAAFEMECKLYHSYRNLDNQIHPARPKGTSYPCPVAGCRDLG
jgi:hypothetical protein